METVHLESVHQLERLFKQQAVVAVAEQMECFHLAVLEVLVVEIVLELLMQQALVDNRCFLDKEMLVVQ
jgi:hypothetical protein